MSAEYEGGPDRETLSLLSAIQTSFHALPTAEQIAGMVGHALRRVPGVARIELTLDDDTESSTATARAPDFPNATSDDPDLVERTLQLRTSHESYGHLSLHLHDEQTYDAYEPFIRNLLNAVATELENRRRTEQLAETKEALEHELRDKDEFLAMLGHELRNPLAAIQTAVALQESTLEPSNDLGRSTDIISRQTRQMIRLVDDLLEVSRASRGKITMDKRPLHLGDVIGDLADDFRPQLEADDREFVVALPDRPLPLVGDRERITQAVGNLLDNALKYSDPPSPIELRLRRDEAEGAAVICVHDQGIGIEPDEIDDLFLPFRQASRARDGQSRGLGLGLSLVQSLVEAHDGTIDVHSAGIGEGSEFCIRLPLEDAAIEEADGSRETERENAGRHILVIEDNEDVAYSLSRVLELEGHRVTLADGARSGLEAYEAERPEVVICDIGLDGGRDGYEVAEHIRQTYESPQLLVALTGYGTPASRKRAREAGFDRFITKPIEPDELYELLVDGE